MIAATAKISDRRRCSRGQVIPVLAVSIVTLTGLAGLAIDTGQMYWTKRRLQNAVDAAAFAAAHELQRGNTNLTTQVRPAALRDAALNGFTQTNSTITVNNPPVSGPNAGNSRFVEVIIAQPVPLTFGRMISGGVTVRARGVAGRVNYADVCVLALDPTASAALRVRGSANITADCGFQANSTNSSGFQVEGGMNLSGDWLGSAGGFNQEGSSGTVSPTPDVGVPPLLDPLMHLPEPNYAGWPAGSYDVGTRTYICPGGQCVFNSRLEIGGPPGVKTFQPGIYVLRDGIEVTSSNVIHGDGVTFFNTGPGNIRLAGQAIINLTAPTSGTYKGILFFVSRSAPAGVVNDLGVGTAQFNFRGAIYAPTQELRVEGSFSGSTPWGVIIGRKVDLAGESTANLTRPPIGEGPDITKVMFTE